MHKKEFMKLTIQFFLILFTPAIILTHGFEKYTLVKTDAGYSDIHQLFIYAKKKRKQGVFSFDTSTNSLNYHHVKAAAQSETNCYVKLSFDENGYGDIHCTPSQEFYLPEIKQWRAAYQLKVGDSLLSHGSQLKPITSVEFTKKQITVYSIEVQNSHTFFVGQYAILTHNMTIPSTWNPMALISLGSGAGITLSLLSGPTLAAATAIGGTIIGVIVLKQIISNQKKHYHLSYNCAEIEQAFKQTQLLCDASLEKRNELKGTCGTSQQHQEVSIPGPCMQGNTRDVSQGTCGTSKQHYETPISGPCLKESVESEYVVCKVINPTTDPIQKEIADLVAKEDVLNESLLLQSKSKELNAKNNNAKTDQKSEKYTYKNGVYGDASYHTPWGNSIKSKRPIDGQAALDNSFPNSKNEKCKRRIGMAEDEYVVLDQTSPGKYHGHVREWNELERWMQNALKKEKIVNDRGKPLK